jgi:hypothetical protein
MKVTMYQQNARALRAQKHQRGAAGWIFLGVVVALIAFVAINYIGAHNKGVKFENNIEATWEDNENILAQVGLKVRDSAGIADKYSDDVKELVGVAMSGRYGEEGSKAMFQWIQEQNPTLDASVYKQIQQIIESGRNQFQNAQTRLVDVKRAYKDELGFFWSGLWLRIAGFPKLDLDDYKIITSEHASDAFESGVDQGFDLGE